MKRLVLLACMLMLSSSAVAVDDTFLVADFEQGLGAEWGVKQFIGETTYQVVTEGSAQVLLAISNASASALVYQQDFNLDDYPVLSWRWKIADTVERGDATRKQTDDYAARVYIIFPHWFYPKTKSLNYIWANKLGKEQFVTSPYTDNSMMIAVESGSDNVGSWQIVRRNLVDDYRKAFGTDPPKKFRIAVMTDTDNTGGKAQAWYDDLRLEKK